MASNVLSCVLCLRAVAPDEMLDFPIEHHAFLKEARAKICQECTEAICVTVAERAEAALAESEKEQAAAAEQGNGEFHEPQSE